MVAGRSEISGVAKHGEPGAASKARARVGPQHAGTVGINVEQCVHVLDRGSGPTIHVVFYNIVKFIQLLIAFSVSHGKFAGTDSAVGGGTHCTDLIPGQAIIEEDVWIHPAACKKSGLRPFLVIKGDHGVSERPEKTASSRSITVKF